MAYDIPATTMAQLAGSSAGAPDAKKFGADLTSGVITGGKQKRLNAEEYANQSAFGPGDISGAMRNQSNIMFKPTPIPGVIPSLDGKTKDTEWKMPSQTKKPVATSTAVSLGGTGSASAAAPTASSSGGGGDSDVKDIDYTNTNDDYWKEIASSGRASEVWIPNLEKKGGAEAASAVAKKYISGLVGSNWGTTSQAAASKKAINTATRHRGTGALLSATEESRSASPQKAAPQRAAPKRAAPKKAAPKKAAPKKAAPSRYGDRNWESDR
tara:strand:+ start:5378 stop:6184 length:807 start_codon:yes stop_codon:yes gene_type:complete